SNNSGHYSFNPIKQGKYVVSITHVGYARTYSPAFDFSGSGEITAPSLELSKAAGELKGVTVTSKKPIVEVKADRTILNVEGTINIRLKKNKTYGFNGSVNAGWNISTYAKYNTGIALNYRYKKINLFGNYNYNKNKNQNKFNLFRTTSADSSFDQHSVMLNEN